MGCVAQYLGGGFAQWLREALRERIRARGIHNSHLLSIAQSGTINLASAENTSD
jgi:ribonucleoside-diphosphate reductase alpha chain